MANLNFGRNIGSSSLGRSNVGFGSTSISGHVTPVFGQRPPSDRRGIPGLGNTNQMNTMNTLSYGSLHSVFSSTDTSTPPLLDLSEFPSLTNRNSDVPPPSPMPGGKPYVGMVKQPTTEASEFTMSSEDFPALPGTHNRDGASPGSNISADKLSGVVVGVGVGGLGLGGTTDGLTGTDLRLVDASGIGGHKGGNIIGLGGAGVGCTTSGIGIGIGGSTTSSSSSTTTKSGILTFADGKVTNIPSSMVSDQFGIVGLLTFIRAAETDPNLVSLALGQDLTALGLNLNSPENLYPTFGGPWAEQPCRPQDIDFHVPPEYLINASIRDKLAPVKLNRYKDDLLFFLFYNNVGDVLQVAAACELYNREWRYHMEEKVWITQVAGMVITKKTTSYEEGTYYFFDPQNWRKVAKEFHLDYSKLEGRPNMNHPQMHMMHTHTA